jgi:hypothetical protein
VGDRARSRVRREDVADGSAAEGIGADRLDGERGGEEPLAGTKDDGVDDQAVLIDQAGLDQRSGEPCTALSEQVTAGLLLLESRDRFSRSPEAIVVSAQSADSRESENTTLGMSFIGLANGPGALGQNPAHLA